MCFTGAARANAAAARHGRPSARGIPLVPRFAGHWLRRRQQLYRASAPTAEWHTRRDLCNHRDWCFHEPQRNTYRDPSAHCQLSAGGPLCQGGWSPLHKQTGIPWSLTNQNNAEVRPPLLYTFPESAAVIFSPRSSCPQILILQARATRRSSTWSHWLGQTRI